MKSHGDICFNVGNIGFRVFLREFPLVYDKSGVTQHDHAYFEYHFVVKGDAAIKVDERSLSLLRNDSILIFPGTFHKFLPCEAESSVLTLSFSIKRNKHGTDYYSAIERSLAGNSFFVSESSPLVTDLIHTVVPAVYSEEIFSFEVMRAGLSMLFIHLLSKLSHEKADAKRPSSSQDQDMRTYIVEEYFNEHYMERISLSALARRLYLSEQQTERMIKKTYGARYREHLAKIRVKSAMELLTETKKSITEVAEAVGYDSYNGFYAAFKKITGITPTDWRKENVQA